MYIAILTLHKQKINMDSFYNSQDLGLAKGLMDCGNQVIVYKSITQKEYKNIESTSIIDGIEVKYIPSIHFENHSLLNVNKMDKGVDCLVCFSDNQIFFPIIFRWCKKHNIPLLPYLGTISSKSSSIIKQKIMEFLNCRSIKLHSKLSCFAKTPDMANELKSKGIMETIVCPVGLDVSRLKNKIHKDELKQIRLEMDILESSQIILFVGRLIPSKQPLELLESLKKIIAANSSFHLLIIGKGPLELELLKHIEHLNISEHVTYIQEVENVDMWKYYSISDYLINLCRDEIYGMAILEAMYYKCNVIALKAPGPSFIIENGKTGYLFDEIHEIVEFVLDKDNYKNIDVIGNNAYEEILNRFTWNYSAKIINDKINQ